MKFNGIPILFFPYCSHICHTEQIPAIQRYLQKNKSYAVDNRITTFAS